MREAAATRGEAAALTDRIRAYDEQGRYQEAIPLAEQALALRERALGPAHPAVAEALTNLAALHQASGAYEPAEALLERALAILASGAGAGHPDLLTPLNNLALIHDERGEHARAEALYLRSLAVAEQALGKDHPDLAGPLSNLASLYRERGDYEQAQPLAERALAIVEAALGAGDPHVAMALDNLAALHEARGEHAQAAALMERSLAILQGALAADHPHLATALNNLASVYRKQGDDERARLLYERALAIWERTLGDSHPYVAVTLHNMASLYWSMARDELALRFFRRGVEVHEHNLGALLATGSEAQKHARLAPLQDETDAIVSFHLRDAPGAAHLALETILRRKGRVLDVTASAIRTLRRQLDEPERMLLDELGRLRSALARHMLGGPTGDLAAYRSRAAALRARIEAIEATLGRQSSRYHARARPTTVAAVQARLPAHTALVELFLYRPRHPRARTPDHGEGPPRYAAYVLRPRGQPDAVDLGEAADIDALVAEWRLALQRRQPGARAHARALHARVMAPVSALLERHTTRHLFVAPDGDLALIPFAALVDEHGRYLIEDHRLTYLTSGRDLLRHDGAPAPRQQAVVMADPHFDATPAHRADAGETAGPPARMSAADQLGIQVAPLPGTAGEAAALRARLAHVEVWTGADATEGRLARLRGPHLLHLATHGLWLADAPMAASLAGSRAPFTAAAPPAALPGDPMLRSGLALAGFNQRAHDADDGFLSALEVASLDLHGTQLVVLSACDTGLGQVKSGQGVHGLRRALVLAGTQTQVMSLWQVADATTEDLMLAYYDRLLDGQGRSEAMRQAQLALLRRDPTAHPYFWAGFIVSGDPTPMTGLEPRHVRSPSPLTAGGLALVVVVALLFGRQRWDARRSATATWGS